jgi:hypothetical protein
LIHIGATAWMLFVAGSTALAALHAWRKLSPAFAATWFGAGLAFGCVWTSRRDSVAALLLPVLVVYLAAALTKGLVERGPLAGRHGVHVLLTGVLTGLVALPLESSALAMGWSTPRGTVGAAHWSLPPGWTGGVPAALVLQWMLVGLVFYGVYKLLDHSGLGRVLQALLILVAAPFLPRVVEGLMDALG